MTEFLVFLPSGIAIGSVYALVALGLVLTYKTSGIFNFAHGGIAAVSAYLFYELSIKQGWHWSIAFGASLLVVGVLGGLIMERLAALLAPAPTVMVVVATVGLLVLLQSLMTAIYGPANIFLESYLPTDTLFTLGKFAVTIEDLAVTGFSLGAGIGLYVLFERTRVGKSTTAVVDDPNLLSLQGTNPAVVRRLSWIIGASFAAISGMFLAPKLGVSVNTLILLVIAAYGAAALGRFENLLLTVAGAMIIGVMVAYLPSQVTKLSTNVLVQNLPGNTPFLLLFLVFLVAPTRLLTERGVANARRQRPIRAFSRPVTYGGFALLGAVLVLVPTFVPEAEMTQYAATLGYFIVFASLGMLVWMSGQISLCQMTFAAVGAATAGHMLETGMSWPLALLIAGAVAIPVGALVSIVAIRFGGIYVAIATFGFAIAMQQVGYYTDLLFGQDQRIDVPRPEIFGINFTDVVPFYYLCLAVAVLAGVIVLAVRASRLGGLLRAMSDSPTALAAHGANTTLIKVVVFCISAFLAALGGVVISGVPQNASGALTGPFSVTVSLVLVAVLGFAGRRPIASPLLAAVLFQLLKIYPPFDTETFIKYQGVIFGALAIFVAVYPSLNIPGVIAKLRRASRDRRETSPGPVPARLDAAPVEPVVIRTTPARSELELVGSGKGAEL
jgi:branched-subunit amino acid ABC-type transport system permease component